MVAESRALVPAATGMSIPANEWQRNEPDIPVFQIPKGKLAPEPGVQGREGFPKRGTRATPKYTWDVGRGADRNYRGLGCCLAKAELMLFRNGADGHGLILVLPNGRSRLITKAADLLPLLADRVRIRVMKDGTLQRELPTAEHANAMLRSEKFLQQFRPLDKVVTEPIYLGDFTLTQPGYNDHGPGQCVFFVGNIPESSKSLTTINAFLAVMDFASDADRTNTVAAALTVMLRRLWPGEKPLILVTASKSHAGKTTIVEFARGTVAKADILYERQDWPMQSQMQRQLAMRPDIGMVVFDNVRVDSAGGGAQLIRSGFLESMLTNTEINLASPGAGSAISIANELVVALNTNDGTLSPDLLNRSVSIHLTPQGSVVGRECPLGNPRWEWLPLHRELIQAELHGMIRKWIDAGRPLDENVKHSMTPWARTIGGILMVNGFANYLANVGDRKTADDPIRRSLAILGASKLDKALTPAQWAAHVKKEGLLKHLVPSIERDTDKGRQRAMGVLLTRHIGERFTHRGNKRIVEMELDGGRRRWVKGKSGHTRYIFNMISSVEVPIEDDKPNCG